MSERVLSAVRDVAVFVLSANRLVPSAAREAEDKELDAVYLLDI